jgi:hypothetical protein
MHDVIVGAVAVLIGAIFCLRGYWAMRVIIPIWGAFAGFLLGAGLVASGTDDGFLRSVLSWMVGLAVAVLFGLFAYLYYEIAIVLAMTSIGFALGTSVMVALGVSWSWAIVLVGVIVGALLAVIAIVGNLPMIVLIVLTAAGGASAVVGGLMLIVGTLQTDELTESGTVTDRLHDDWWWFAVWAALFVVGIVAQIRAAERLRTSMRAAWEGSGGRTMRAA